MNAVPPNRWGWDVTPGQVRTAASIRCRAPGRAIRFSSSERHNSGNGTGDFRGGGSPAGGFPLETQPGIAAGAAQIGGDPLHEVQRDLLLDRGLLEEGAGGQGLAVD